MVCNDFSSVPMNTSVSSFVSAIETSLLGYICLRIPCFFLACRSHPQRSWHLQKHFLDHCDLCQLLMYINFCWCKFCIWISKHLCSFILQTIVSSWSHLLVFLFIMTACKLFYLHLLHCWLQNLHSHLSHGCSLAACLNFLMAPPPVWQHLHFWRQSHHLE